MQLRQLKSSIFTSNTTLTRQEIPSYITSKTLMHILTGGHVS